MRGDVEIENVKGKSLRNQEISLTVEQGKVAEQRVAQAAKKLEMCSKNV